MSSKKSHAGRRAYYAGQAFQEILNIIHTQYAAQGKAVIEFLGTKARPIKRDGKLIWIAGRSMPDYIGAITGTGRMICFDAKSTKNKYSWSLGKAKIHQRDTLSRFAGADAICFFLVEHRPEGKLYLLRTRPGLFWPQEPPPKIKFKAHTIDDNRDEGEVIVIPSDIPGGYDWLKFVREYWRC